MLLSYAGVALSTACEGIPLQRAVAARAWDASQPPVVLLGDLTLVRPLGGAGVPVILGTTDPDDATLRSRYVRAHVVLPGFDDARRGQTAALLADLGARLADTLGRRVPLFCGTDAQLELVYHHRDALAASFLLPVARPEIAWSLHDKQLFAELCERADVRAPRAVPPGVALQEGLAALREPIVVKPRRKAAWRALQQALFGGAAKARVFATRRELLAHPAIGTLQHEILAQEYIPGATADLYSFHGYADEAGRLLAWFAGRKVRTYPDFAGESSLIELTHAAEPVRMGRDVAARLGLTGPFKIDLIRDARTGELYTLEVNARFNLWHYLGAVHGVNLPHVAYEHLVHGRAPAHPPEYVPRHRWLNLYRDVQALRELRAAGRLSLGAWLRSVARPGTVYEAFAWRDPAPFAHWVAAFARGRFGR